MTYFYDKIVWGNLMSTKRDESRTRYFIRKISEKKGWNVAHVNKNGDFLEEQEITYNTKYFKINIPLIYLLGIAGQIIIIIWSFIKNKKDK